MRNVSDNTVSVTSNEVSYEKVEQETHVSMHDPINAPRVKRALFDLIAQLYSYITMSAILAVCLLILAVLWHYGHTAISWTFLTTEPATSSHDLVNSGILTPLVGTLLLTLIGMIFSFPFALATAVYLCFFVNNAKFGNWLQTSVDVLAGLPTIVIALFSRAIFTHPAFGILSTTIENTNNLTPKAFGKSFLVAGITMAIMILPFMIKAMLSALKDVPKTYFNASIALGTTPFHTIRHVILLAGMPGLITGAVLGMGRIMGDTAIVWLTLGGTLRMTGLQPWYSPDNWISMLQNTGSTLTSYIYFTSPAGEGNQYTVAFGASLVLMVIILFLNGIMAFVGKSRSIKES